MWYSLEDYMSFLLWLFPPSSRETAVHVQTAATRISNTEVLETHFGSHPLTYLSQFWVDAVHEFKRREPARMFDSCSFPTRFPTAARPHHRT